MKHWNRTIIAAAALGSIAALGLPVLGPFIRAANAQAGEKPVKPVRAFTIVVNPLRDMGGAAAKGPDGKPLTDRLANAMRMYLGAFAKARYHVVGIDGEPPKELPRYTVEGDLSALEVGEPSERKYMVVMRVFKEDKPRKLVAQFAGSAPSLRGLTGNLDRQQPGSSTANGLLGAIAKEIGDLGLDSLSGGDAFADMLKSVTAVRRVTVDVIGDGAGNQKPRQQVMAGDKFQLRVNSQDAGTVYILAVDGKGRLSTPYAQTEPLDVAPGQPIILPPNVGFEAPAVKAPTTVEYLVMVRKKGAVKGGGAAGDPGDTVATADEQGKASEPLTNIVYRESRSARTQFGTASILPAREAQESNSLELMTVLPTLPKMDPGAEGVLKQWQSDPQGTWHGVRVKVAVVPAR